MTEFKETTLDELCCDTDREYINKALRCYPKLVAALRQCVSSLEYVDLVAVQHDDGRITGWGVRAEAIASARTALAEAGE